MNKKPLYFKQSDPKWKDIPYTIDGDKNETIGTSGCGPICTAMIIASVKDSKITPVEMCKLAIEWKDRTPNNGTEWEFFGKVAARYNIPFKQSSGISVAIEALREGAYVICSMKPGRFTKNGHYILAWDVKDNNIIVHDPVSTASERTYADFKTFEDQCKQYFVFFVKQQEEQGYRPVLKKGVKGEAVKTLQILLNKLGYKLVVDGSFGPITEGAVRDFQRSRKLVVDGIVGTKTWNKLYEV